MVHIIPNWSHLSRVVTTATIGSQTGYLPSDDDEHIEAIPGFGEVRLLPVDAHRHEFDAHLEEEEGEDEVVEAGQDLTPPRLTLVVVTRLVHAERYAVENDHAHADAFEPREVRLRQMMNSVVQR